MVDPLMGACTFSNETLPDPLPAEPFGLVMAWMQLAAGTGPGGVGVAGGAKVQPNPNAMTLATVDADGRPSVRVVLARGVDAARGTVTFYTNYASRKGRAIGEVAGRRIAAGFFWDDLDRQVCIEGLAARSPSAESDAYFNARPLASRIGAWASDQSRPLASRQQLIDKNLAAQERFGYREGLSAAQEAAIVVPRPAWWGGVRLFAQRVELWRGHSARLHDRAAWVRELTPCVVDGVDGYSGGPWTVQRLQP